MTATPAMSAGDKSPFVRPPTAQEAVLAELRRQLTDGRLPPGTPIRQETLAADLGVSRVPVREALKVLQADRLVEYIPHRGYFVSELSSADLDEVNRLRRLLELEAIRESIPRMTTEDLGVLRARFEAIVRALDGEDVRAVIEANRDFRFGLMEPCHMPRLMHLIRILEEATLSHQYLYYSTMSASSRRATATAYEQMLVAATAGDVESVAALLLERLNRARTFVQAHLES